MAKPKRSGDEKLTTKSIQLSEGQLKRIEDYLVKTGHSESFASFVRDAVDEKLRMKIRKADQDFSGARKRK